MSRIGKKPIEIPSGVEAILKEGSIEVKGALGSRHFDFSEKLRVDIVDKSITVNPKNLEKETRPNLTISGRVLHSSVYSLFSRSEVPTSCAIVAFSRLYHLPMSRVRYHS